MDGRRRERVEDWEPRPFSGYDGLRELAAGSFSGAARAGDAWLFLLNGRVVGAVDGDVGDFEDADGTAYDAPHPGLVLLFAMQERGGDVRGQYYTEDTPLSEVDETLSEANFTGFVELSENVLSGDYYTVYYGGRSLPVAFVGPSEELLTDDEAFDRADDEVGTYAVRDVDIEVRDVPEPEPDDGAAAAGPAAGAADDVTPDGAATGDDGPDAASESEAPETTDEATSADADAASDERRTPDQAAPEADVIDDGGGTPGDRETDAAEGAVTAGNDRTEAGRATESDDAARRSADDRTGSGAAASARSEEAAPATEGRADATETADRQSDDEFSREEAWRETTRIPSLDPDDDASDEPAPTASPADREDSSRIRRADADGPTGRQRTESPAGDRVRELESRLRSRTEELESARERVAELEAETESLRGDREDLRTERDRLEERVAELEEELAEARAASATTTTTRRDGMDPIEALSATNLFVRTGSRGKPTLESVAQGADAQAVNDNLRLEHHTRFDASEVTVAGEPFDEWLRSTAEYAFVSWLVRELPFEIRETGGEAALRDLYDALPRIDRAQLHGSVELEREDGGSDVHEFDVVVRDKMGAPLVVADINDSRDPVSGEMMESLVEASRDVVTGGDLVSSVYVTSSFFSPDALEAATAAASGGFLSRDSRESFVKIDRKTGFHLCLAEARDGTFHVNVPEL